MSVYSQCVLELTAIDKKVKRLADFNVGAMCQYHNLVFSGSVFTHIYQGFFTGSEAMNPCYDVSGTDYNWISKRKSVISLTHFFCIVTLYGDIEMNQNWLR